MFDNHIIPPNISDTGSMFGISGSRKFIEAGVLAAGALAVNSLFLGGLSPALRIILIVVLMVPALIALIGIEGKSVTEYIADYIDYRFKAGFMPYKIPMPLKKEDD